LIARKRSRTRRFSDAATPGLRRNRFSMRILENFLFWVAGNVISAEGMGSMRSSVSRAAHALCGFWGTRGGAVRPALHTFGDNVLPGLPEFAPSVSGQDQLALAVQAAVRWSMHQLWRRRKGTELCKKAAPNWLVPSFRSILVRSGFYLDFTMQEEQYLITEGDASLNRGGRGFAKSCDCAKV